MSSRPVFIRITNQTGVAIDEFDIVDNLDNYLWQNNATTTDARFYPNSDLQTGLTFSVPDTASSFQFSTSRVSGATWSLVNDAYIEIGTPDTYTNSTNSSSWTIVVNAQRNTTNTSKWMMIVTTVGGDAAIQSVSTVNFSTFTSATRVLNNQITPNNLYTNIWIGDTVSSATSSVTFNFTGSNQFKSAQFFKVWAYPVNDPNGWTTGKTINHEISSVNNNSSRISSTHTLTFNERECAIGFVTNTGPVTYTADSDTTNGAWETASISSVGTSGLGNGVSILIQEKIVRGNGSQTHNTSFSSSNATSGLIRFYL